MWEPENALYQRVVEGRQTSPALNAELSISEANDFLRGTIVMADDAPDREEVHRLVKQACYETRGHASFWEYPPERRLAELEPAQELVRHLYGDDFVGGLRFVEQDPPDLSIDLADGTHLGIEVTELVDPKAAEAARHLKKQRGTQATFDQTPDDAPRPEWTDKRLALKLKEYIRRKDNKLELVRGMYDEIFLAIMTDERDIDMKKAARVAACLDICTVNIDRAFLILSYTPSADQAAFPGGYPVFKIGMRRIPSVNVREEC